MMQVQDGSMRNNGVSALIRGFAFVVVAFLVSGCSLLPTKQSFLSPGSSCSTSGKELPLTGQSSKIVTLLPEPVWQVTPEVQKEVRRLLISDRNHLEKTLSKMAGYRSIVEEIFVDEGIPTALVSLAFVESGFNPEARSPAGAVGMWQFMKPTAMNYGLKISRGEDQRKDPILSTIAAARHLRDLYKTYGDWHLALAAYNAGTGGVGKAIAKSGHTDFWSIARSGKLTKQTREFVPKIVAVSLIMDELKSSDIITLAQNFEWLGEGTDVESIRIANWSGDRRPSAG